MIAYISALILLALALLLIVLRKTYYFFPVRELKRQARSGDRLASTLYRAVAYGASLRLLLWILIGLAVAGSFALLTIAAPAWLVFIAVAGLVWYGFAWSPHAQVTSVGAAVVMFVTPAVAWVLYYTHPLLDRIAGFFEAHRPVTFHTGLFEREDLISLIEEQRQLADSRITHDELELVLHALSFGDKTVASVMIPRRAVKTVTEADVIGPILMDELYESKYSRFPVVDAATGDHLLGVLYLRDLISVKHGDTVAEVMKQNVYYIHENQTLYQVLHAFLTTKHLLFIVINSAEEYVGVITIEDVLEQVIGHKIEDDFDSYDDKRAVAAVGRAPAKKHAASQSAVEADQSVEVESSD